MKVTIPTWLTLFRIALIPLLVVVFYWDFKFSNLFACAVFVIAALTDWLDGWIARRYKLESAFGAFLDPVADKLMIAVALFLIVQTDGSALMAIVAAVIVGREISISALREWMAEVGELALVKVAVLGKIKTIMQMVAISILLFKHTLVGVPIYQFGKYLLVVSAVLTIWSGVLYVLAALPAIRAAHKDA